MIRSTALAVLLATSFIAYASEGGKAKADPEKGKAIAEKVCVACHSADGNSVIPTNPILAGQGADYIYKQLSNFKSVGGKPALRNSPVMAGMAAALSDEDMRNLAAWFSSQKMKPATAKNADLAKVGESIWRRGDFKKGTPACAGCHGPTGAGLPAQYPRLSGQHPDYTKAQLEAFRAGTRTNDAEKVMRTIAGKLSDDEIKAVTEYIAGVR